MATAAKKASAAKPAAKKPAAKSATKPAAKAAGKTAAKPRAKKVVEPPPPVVYVSAYTVGNKVTHPSFGDGKVLSIDRDQLTIQFGKDEKVILDGFVKAGSKS